jgi:hypothetical protein
VLQVDYCLKLVNLGIEKSIVDLESMKVNLEILSTLVYECSMDISLSEYEQMSEFEILDLLLKDSTEENIVLHLKVNL